MNRRCFAAVVLVCCAAQAFAQAGRLREQTEALLALAQAQQALGLYREALRDLNKALAIAEQAGDAVRLTSLRTARGAPQASQLPRTSDQQLGPAVPAARFATSSPEASGRPA